MSRALSLLAVVGIAAGGWWLWKKNQVDPLPQGIVSSNGRVEAVQVDVATKYAGRVEELLAQEGDLVEPGQLIARMDTAQLQAQLAEYQARLAEVEQSVEQAKADIVKAQSDVELAEKQADRSRRLLEKKAASQDDYDVSMNALAVARANLGANQAALRTQNFAVKAAEAQVRDIQTQISDAELTSPTRGRVLYRLAEKGEVLPAGGKVITLIDLTDVYMQVYLPARDAVRTRVGAEARIVLDAIPEYAGQGKVSFVAPQAQFTPKEVETLSERDKLMFRVKVRVPPERAQAYLDRIKTGIRGVAYIRTNADTAWPEYLNRPYPDTPPDSFPSQ